MRLRALCAYAAGLGLCACTYVLPPLPPDVEHLPSTLSQTGLYADASLQLVAADVSAYAPSFELWSDGARKRRFIRLPQGTRIDTSNMDDWRFPIGTQIWKEFVRSGKRVETRLIQRVRATNDGWAAAAYIWDADQREARLSRDGADDTLETTHDVPTARSCPACHAGRSSFVLGFSALQLAHAPRRPGDLTLAQLVAAGTLSHAPTGTLQVPGEPATQAALGYLHANCGNCHSAGRPLSARYVRPPVALDLWLRTNALSAPEATPTYRSSMGSFVRPRDAANSGLLTRMQGRSFMKRRMPPVATEYVDKQGIALVQRWIQSLDAPVAPR